ncbi:hypothetical protein [Streptomyces syringium]|uniref:hypothetical protein n=1 Tax=Streptomyces syringium TaxID=76729 RepID=UPI0037D1A6D3
MPTPDYALIDQLERELGITRSESEKVIRPSSPVCLIKNCSGADIDFRTWSGALLRRIHEH